MSLESYSSPNLPTRCRLRRRSCTGPFDLTCKGRGRAFEDENCESQPDNNNNNGGGGGFERLTTQSDRNNNFERAKLQSERSQEVRLTNGLRRRRRRKKFF